MKIYLITKNNNDFQIFTEENNEKAKLWFEAYLYGNNEYSNFKLYKIEGIENLKKIFITGGFEQINSRKSNEDIKQIALDFKKASEEKKSIEMTKLIFKGEKIV